MEIKNIFNEVVYEYDGSLKETLEEFAKLNSTLSNYPINLDLSNMDLSNTNLEDIGFSGTNLEGTNLSGTNLNNAFFHNCKINESTNFIGSKIRDEILKQNPIYYNTNTQWDIMTLDEKIIMGCQCHHLRTWENITDDVLRKIDENCVPDFRIWCDRVFKEAKIHQKEYLDSIGYITKDNS